MADTTITIPAGSALDEELERIAKQTGHSKSDVALDALIEWLEEHVEAQEIASRIARNEPTFTLQEVRKHLGLDD